MYRLTRLGVHSPYHLASSSLIGETAAGFDFEAGAAGFFLNRATVLVAPALAMPAGWADRAAELRGLPNISDTPREAVEAAAAREAMGHCK